MRLLDAGVTVEILDAAQFDADLVERATVLLVLSSTYGSGNRRCSA